MKYSDTIGIPRDRWDKWKCWKIGLVLFYELYEFVLLAVI